MAGVSFSETKIKPPDLYNVVSGLLETYGMQIADATEKTSKIVANNTAKKLRKAGTFNGGAKFKKGWDVRGTRIRGIGGIYTVYNKEVPGLAHLLEFGHAKRNGGRTRAFNFIAPIADEVEQEFRDTFVDVVTGEL